MQRAYSTQVSLVGLVTFLFASGPVIAETITNGAEFRNSPHMIDHLRKFEAETLGQQGQQQDKNLGLQQGCTTGFSVKVIDVGVIEPIEFAENETHPAKGIWRIGYDMFRCGDTKRYNTLFKAMGSDVAPIFGQYYPGVTRADVHLVRDAMRTVSIAASALPTAPKDCNAFAVFDMKVLSPANQQPGATWVEAWTIKKCNKLATATVTFVPDADGKGTSFGISFPKNAFGEVSE